MSTHVGDIFFDAKINDKPYKQGLSSIEKSTSAIFSKLGKALTVTALVAGVTQLVNKTATLGDTVDKMSQKLGMSNKAYQEWDFIMQRSGASIDSMTVAMKTLASSVETGKDALAELGISQEQARSLSQEELFTTVIKQLQGVEDVTHRTYLAGQLLGRGATELGAVLNLSAQDMDALRQRVANLGGIMSDVAVKNSAQFKDALTDVKMAFRGIGNTIAEYVLPVLTTAINKYIIPAIQAVANAIRSLFAVIGRVTGFFKRGASAVKSIVGKGTQKDAQKTSNALGGVGNATKGVGSNAGKAKKQVQALKRELLGFDQITKLTKQDSATGTTGTGGVGGGGGIDVGTLDEYTAGTNALGDAIGRLQDIKLPPALEESLQHLKKSFSDLFDVLGDLGEWSLENVVKPLGDWLINEALPPSIDTLASAIDVVTNAIDLLGSVLEPLWKPLIKPCLEFLLNYQVDKIKTLGDVLSEVAQFLEDLKNGWDKATEMSGELKIGLKDGFSDAWDKIKKKWAEIKNKKAEAKISLSDKFSSAWKKVKGAWNKLKDKKATITLSFKNLITSGWNKIATAVNNARAKSKIVQGLFPSPLPKLAQGGYAKANTPQLAVIGDNRREGEIVAPESKLEAMARMASEGGNTQVIALLTAILQAVTSLDLDVSLDGEKIKNNTVKRINQHTISTGRLELII